MIALKTFAATIQNGLNTVSGKDTFRIFADMGTYKRAQKSRTAKQVYINGVLRAGASSIVPTQGLTVATQSVLIEIIVPLYDHDTEEQIVEKYRALLDGYFAHFDSQPITENGKTYTVGAVYTLADTGTVEVRDGVGTSITLSVGADYSYIENGLNSYDFKFELDGYFIPYTSAKIVKQPNVQADSFSDTRGRGTSVNISFNRSFDFQLPALSGGLGDIILDRLLGDDLNKRHTLKLTIGRAQPRIYNVVFGATDISLQGVDNAGNTISLIEGAF